MNSVKKINLLFCLVFSFIFLFGNVLSVQAESIQEQQTLQQCIDPKEYPNEIAECKVSTGEKTQTIMVGKKLFGQSVKETLTC